LFMVQNVMNYTYLTIHVLGAFPFCACAWFAADDSFTDSGQVLYMIFCAVLWPVLTVIILLVIVVSSIRDLIRKRAA
jgi:hypothetical protein